MTARLTRRSWLRLVSLLMVSRAVPTWAAERESSLIAQLQERLADAVVMRGLFEQRKMIKGFRQALVSKGDFVVARQRGVIWRTREPVVNLMVMTRDRLTSREANGRILQQLDSSREPAVRLITELMFAMLSADLATLAQRFKFDGEMRSDGWRIVLVPKDTALAQWASRIEINGDRHVRLVQWQDAMGDTTVIRMTAHQAASVLNRDEEVLLG